MTFNEYIESVKNNGSLSDVKLLILKTLWGADLNKLSSKLVSSKHLLELTGQKYFDRRARELRDQLGCDIETYYNSEISDHAWILKSEKLNQIVNREYLTEKQKAQLFESAKYKCSTCGIEVEPGIRGLQADHKVPLSRNGSNDISNWQAMCNNCNVGKRRACENCELDCYQCSWAFPEKIGIPLIVPINNDLLGTLKQYAISNGISISEVVAEATIEYITKDRLNKKKN